MIRIPQLRIRFEHDEEELRRAVARELRLRDQVGELKIVVKKRAIDARGREGVRFSYTLDVELPEGVDEQKILRRNKGLKPTPDESYTPPTQPVAPGAERPVVVGTGPCGLFVGLVLARAGLRPILLERGKAAGDRARDVTGFWRRGLDFQPESNVQFGEGGAGTFSDGKLYTQIKDPQHRIKWLLRELVGFGAPEDILVKGRPHIGTDRLIKVVRNIRAEIIERGGEVRFGVKMVGLEVADGVVRGVETEGGEVIPAGAVVLALGHSARDSFEMLHGLGVVMEPKSFSVGARIEHPQGLVDRAQYGDASGHPLLGSAPYKFAWHDRKGSGRSAYSFCMCPGGLVVASSSEEGGVVTNGMSSYARAEANANAGFMVGLEVEDYGGSIDDPLAGVRFQRDLEQRAYAAGGGGFKAPAQLLGDLIDGRASTEAGAVTPSYEPGVEWGDLRAVLPDFVTDTLVKAARPIARRLEGFDLRDAVLTGVETRSSSPVRVLRDRDSLQSPTISGLYPAGEGAGYAGGIISAAADGLKVAEAVLAAV